MAKLGAVFAAFLLWLGVHSAAAHADERPRTDANVAAEQIDLAGRQRMLSQRMAAATCLAMANIDYENRRRIAEASWRAFDAFLLAIRYGDDQRGWPEQNARDVLAAIDEVDRTWQRLKFSILQIAAGDHHPEVVRQFIHGTRPLLMTSNALVQALVAEYGGAALASDKARTVDVAGRQRMLTQRMMKEACLASVGVGRDKNIDLMLGTMQQFDQSLKDLQDPPSQSGLVEPFSEELRAQLARISVMWQTYKSGLIKVSRAGSLDAILLGELAGQSDRILKQADLAVKMYVGE